MTPLPAIDDTNEDAFFWAEGQTFPGCKWGHAFVLKLLAYFSDQSGHCIVNRAQLVEATRLTDRTVRKKLRDLETAGRIRILPDRFVLNMFDEETPQPKRPSYLRLVT
jgi:hypothetical protein